MSPQVDVAALLRYLTGESPEDEALQVQAWCRLHTENAALLEALRCGGDKDVAQLEVDVAHGMERLQNRLDSTLAPPAGVPDRALKDREVVRSYVRRQGVFKGQPLRSRAWYAVIGTIASALVITAGIYGYLTSVKQTSALPTIYATSAGQRANITLPDGSQVELNVGSQLQVPADFAQGNHTVRLTGEALFSVEHHDGAPLTVVAGATTTRVLGTAFLVRHYATDTVTTVAVRDGKVSVQGVVLTAHQFVDVSHGGVTPIGVATPDQFAFVTGELIIDHQRLHDAIPALNRWYDADIRVADPLLADYHLEGAFSQGSLSELSTMLTFLLHVRVERNGRVLTLYPQQ